MQVQVNGETGELVQFVTTPAGLYGVYVISTGEFKLVPYGDMRKVNGNGRTDSSGVGDTNPGSDGSNSSSVGRTGKRSSRA